ncbi:MAG: hypothetical protein Q8920_12225 [Bacillota bacterium]|nr:hypothetical protein [Bacillota bacterium]
METTPLSILIISLPEAFLNLIIVMLIAGSRELLRFNKGNAIRFFFSLGFMVLSSAVIRPLISEIVQNMILSFLIHTFIYAIVIAIIYRMNFRKSFLSVLLMGFTFMTLENVYIPFLVVYVFKGQENFYAHFINVFLASLPERLVQMGLIIFLWKYQFAFAVTRINKKFYNFFTVFIFVLSICEAYFSFIFTMYFPELSLENQILFSITLISSVVVFYLLVYRFIYITIKGLITQGYKQYKELEDNAEKAITTVHTLLENNDFESAKNFVRNLIGEENQ